MITVEELFEKVETHQKKFNTNFWWALWLILEELAYYGGADVLFNKKVYEIRTKKDAVMLFLDIYDVYKNVYQNQ